MQLEERNLVGNEDTPLDEIKQLVAQDEERGYGAPFVTIAWREWLEMQTRVYPPTC